MNSNRTELTGAGIQTSAIAFGGGTPGLETETWNGTNWTATTNMATPRKRAGGAGANNTAALAFGGESPGTFNATEEWNTGVAVGTWSTGGSLNTARTILAGAGIQAAALAFGGSNPPSSPNTCLLYTSPSPRDRQKSRMPSSA